MEDLLIYDLRYGKNWSNWS